MGRSPKENP